MTATTTHHPIDDPDAAGFLDDHWGDAPQPPPRRRRHRRRWILLVSLAVVVSLVGGLAFAGYRMASRLPNNVHRIQGAFKGIDESTRPTKPAEAANSMNFLLVGVDSRSDEPTTGRDANAPEWTYGAQRSDVMMLVHLAADRSGAAIVSLPRDSWVPIPGRGSMKLNAAYSWGGPPLLINTMEQLTGVRIDNFAVVDFYGLKKVVDTVDGVDIRFSQPTVAGQLRLPAGLNHLDGEQALAYVRERHALPQGDLDRVRRQQNLLRAIMARANTINPVRDPVLTYNLLDAATRSVSVDDTLTEEKMRALATSMLGLRGSSVAFLTAPVRGTGMEGDQSVVYLDGARCVDLWQATRGDTLPNYLSVHSGDQLPETPR